MLPKKLLETGWKSWIVPESCHGQPLYRFLSDQLNIKPKAARGRVIVDWPNAVQKPLTPQVPLWMGATVKVKWLKTPSLDSPTVQDYLQKKSKELESRILYRDDHVWVLDKPAGLACQGGSKSAIHLELLLKKLSNLNFKLVHRLDRDTTGILVIATNLATAQRLNKLFRESKVMKTYHSILMTRNPISIPSQVNGYISKVMEHGKEKMKYYPLDEPKALIPSHAQTIHAHCRLVSSFNHYHLVEFIPTTGRKHQLRVIAAQVINAPVLGDYKYGPGSIKNVPMHLHLSKLTLPDWFGKNSPLELEAKLPHYFKKTMNGA